MNNRKTKWKIDEDLPWWRPFVTKVTAVLISIMFAAIILSSLYDLLV
jgi:hypothetical protein